MRVRLASLWYRLRSSLWTVPALMSAAAVVLAVFASHLDDDIARDAPLWASALLYTGDLDGSRALLTTIASSMITVAGVAFSITVVALSLASSQFGPRLLGNFMRDRGNQVVLGTFLATYLFCLMALRTLGGSEDTVPVVSTSVALLLAIASLGVLIFFIHHISTAMQAEHVVDAVARDLLTAVDQLVPDLGEEAVREDDGADDDPQQESGIPLASCTDGYIQAVDEERLVELAEENDLIVRLRCRAGHFVVAGECLAMLTGAEIHDETAAALRRCFLIGRVRTGEQDAEYGIHQLVEVALRALSPGINDPFTAVACVDWLGAVMTKIGRRRLRSPRRRDADGRLRLVTDPLTFGGMLAAAFDQIRQNAGGHPAVSIRLLEALRSVADELREDDRYEPVREQAHMTYTAANPEGLATKDRNDLERRYRAVLDIVGEGEA